MRKSVFIVTLTALMFSASTWAQKIAPRCRTCGRKLTECQYKGHHPNKNSSPNKNNKPAKARPQRHSDDSAASRTIRFADGIYSGVNVDGVRQGYGTFKYNNGDVYTGWWANNKRDNTGTCKYKNGDRYEGNWKDDTYDGYGHLTCVNGDKYGGRWESGKLNGYGNYRKADGSTYNGKFKDGQKDGGGLLITTDGDTIAGEFRNDKAHGYNYIRFKDGTRVMLMRKDDIPNGFCFTESTDGNLYYQYQKDGKFDGPVIIIKPDKTICGLIYSNGKLIDSNSHKIIDKKQVYYDLKEPDLSYIRTKPADTHFGEIIYSDGGVYIGDLREGMPYGFGILVYVNRNAYIGTVEMGFREGQGAYVYFNSGDCYHGQWHNDKLNGIATLVFGKDGTTCHNVYKNGTYEGTAPAL